MKKNALIFCTTLLLTPLLSCSKNDNTYCYLPDGAPAIAMANIISGKKVANQNVETIITTGEDVVAKCQNGEADMAILPTNAAVTICSLKKEYKLFTINVLGLLYLVGSQNITSLSELTNEKLYSIGLQNTPEFVFKTILDANNIDYTSSNGVEIEYASDASSIIPLLLQGKAKFAILGEPAVTNLLNKASASNKQMYRLFDLQQLWQQATNSDSAGYPQASLIVKNELLENKKFVKDLTNKVFTNNEFINDNVSTLNELMQSAGSSLDVNYTMDILNRCNLNPTFAFNAKEDLEKYLNTFASMQRFLPLDDKIFYEPNK